MAFNPEIHRRRSVRLKGYDYGQAGAYFITICTHERDPLFGEIRNGEMHLNAFGQIAYQEWLNTPAVRPNVSLDVFVVMPNHLHGILLITGPDDRMDSLPPAADEGVCNTPLPFKSPSNTIGSIVRGYKAAVTKQINLLKSDEVGIDVWQRSYHEHIIRNERSYQHISDYIINNPLQWEADMFHKP
ncbi:transposase [Rufibacter sp. XAAS-G3-1]|uniref:transposase n=1 Tax=Rufibacter sp. XAAS-G3-1 TaxID=2729134 RepID=UPI0015E79739|nr:transposase [Rufibacter sp. XAAS-G3-1]